VHRQFRLRFGSMSEYGGYVKCPPPRTGLMRHEKLDTTKRYDYRPGSEMHEVANLFPVPAWNG
jgi:hypothetical protein